MYGEQLGCSDDELKAAKAANEAWLGSVGHRIEVGFLSGVVAVIAAAFI